MAHPVLNVAACVTVSIGVSAVRPQDKLCICGVLDFHGRRSDVCGQGHRTQLRGLGPGILPAERLPPGLQARSSDLRLSAGLAFCSSMTQYRNRSTPRSPMRWLACAANSARALPLSIARNAARRSQRPGARPCRVSACAATNRQAERDSEEGVFSGYNRSGSKDSQLR